MAFLGHGGHGHHGHAHGGGFNFGPGFILDGPASAYQECQAQRRAQGLPTHGTPDPCLADDPNYLPGVHLSGMGEVTGDKSAAPLVALLLSALYLYTQRKKIMRSLKRSLIASLLLSCLVLPGCVTRGEFSDFVSAVRAHSDATKDVLSKANADPALPAQVQVNRQHEASDFEGLLQEAEKRAGLRDAVVAPVGTK